MCKTLFYLSDPPHTGGYKESLNNISCLSVMQISQPIFLMEFLFLWTKKPAESSMASEAERKELTSEKAVTTALMM